MTFCFYNLIILRPMYGPDGYSPHIFVLNLITVFYLFEKLISLRSIFFLTTIITPLDNSPHTLRGVRDLHLEVLR